MSRLLRAPELDGGIAWFNAERPLSIRDLRGHVVVLDFWTYCCVNCMHVQPVLAAIEERFERDPLVVIGVHSGKFSAEHDPERIRDAIGRYAIRHPVVVDDRMAIWGRYKIRSWPTLVVIRPDGTIAAVAPGEPKIEVLGAFLQRELDLAHRSGSLSTSSTAARPSFSLPTVPALPLHYPGKASLLPDGRIAVSDSGHHRILITSAEGEVELTIGSGLHGLTDGPIASAAFDDPQGTCWHEGSLYVADTRNHALRKVDLGARTVSTVAGTGALGTAPATGRIDGREVALRSPWDLAAVGDAIFVAMAGSHQLFRFWPGTGEIEVYAGTGVEALIDGPVARSAWAQPSGLSERGGTLYVADSETSAVRAVDLKAGTVRTLVGEGLFDWGDQDGNAEEALLQHGLGVAAIEGGVLIADTYNGKIRRCVERAGSAEIQTLLTGLHEPGSVAVDQDGSLVIADTNAHRIVRAIAGQALEIRIQGAPEPRFGAAAPHRAREPSSPSASEVSGLALRGWFTALLELQEGAGISPGSGAIELLLEAAEGCELSVGAPIQVALEVSRRSDLLLLERERFSVTDQAGTTARVRFEVRVSELPEAMIEAEIVATLDYLVCRAEAHAACFRGQLSARIPVRLLASGGAELLSFPMALSPIEG